jgi:hypothetical protein
MVECSSIVHEMFAPSHAREFLSTVRHGHAIEKHYQFLSVKSPLHQLVESDYQ